MMMCVAADWLPQLHADWLLQLHADWLLQLQRLSESNRAQLSGAPNWTVHIIDMLDDLLPELEQDTTDATRYAHRSCCCISIVDEIHGSDDIRVVFDCVSSAETC